jgi:hypothetical protein
MYIANAFSLNMLTNLPARLSAEEVSLDTARSLAATATSAVGHESTAAIFATLLGREVPVARINLRLQPGDELLVGQYVGPRLPEGATTLPEGAAIRWVVVRCEPNAADCQAAIITAEEVP